MDRSLSPSVKKRFVTSIIIMQSYNQMVITAFLASCQLDFTFIISLSSPPDIDINLIHSKLTLSIK